jgi:selenocysteine lyase/cysteine desulfurase
VNFGPSTSSNTYVLAHAFGGLIGPGDEVLVTNQDHEANTGAVRRMAERVGAKLVEWRIDPVTGLLDVGDLDKLLTERTKLMTFPHCSNIIGAENDVKLITAKAHAVGARVIVDGVSFAPHTFPDVGDLNPDIYLFSLYKTYSVHQGLMVLRNGIANELPNQGHYFNSSTVTKRLTPAGPDHAQEASAGAVLDYVETLAQEHDVKGSTLRETVQQVCGLWREHEAKTLSPVLQVLAAAAGVRLLGPTDMSSGLHRCPTVAFVPGDRDPSDVANSLVAAGIMCSAGNYYASRVLEGVGVDPRSGVVRLSWVHYTSEDDTARLAEVLERVLA